MTKPSGKKSSGKSKAKPSKKKSTVPLAAKPVDGKYLTSAKRAAKKASDVAIVGGKKATELILVTGKKATGLAISSGKKTYVYVKENPKKSLVGAVILYNGITSYRNYYDVVRPQGKLPKWSGEKEFTDPKKSVEAMVSWAGKRKESDFCFGPQKYPQFWIQHLIKKNIIENVAVGKPLAISSFQTMSDLLKQDNAVAIGQNSATLSYDMRSGFTEFFERITPVAWKKTPGVSSGLEARFLVLRSGDMTLHHMNMLFFDHDKKTVERFEPYIRTFANDETVDLLLSIPAMLEAAGLPKDRKKIIDHLHKLDAAYDIVIKQTLSATYPFYKYSSSLELEQKNTGPQALAMQGYSKCETAKTMGGSGLCVTWSLLYAHLRMITPGSSPKKITEALMSLDKEVLGDLIMRYNGTIEYTFPKMFNFGLIGTGKVIRDDLRVGYKAPNKKKIVSLADATKTLK